MSVVKIAYSREKNENGKVGERKQRSEHFIESVQNHHKGVQILCITDITVCKQRFASIFRLNGV